MSAMRNPRWLISFADLCLLLLGFFVLLHARSNNAIAAQSIRTAFAAKSAGEIRSFRASGLFEPGEAVLRADAAASLARAGARAAATKGRIRIQSLGVDAATVRFDGWELAAARAAAVARAVSRGGLAAERIDITVGPAASGDKGQLLILALS